ncbi:MAG: triphosphoribosyl-dephospho-CoA synthase [Burkholderiaceae bacterium]
MSSSLDSATLEALVLHACELEVLAFKPGNVSVDSPGHGMQADDFVQSARAIAGPICAPGIRVGRRVFDAVEATQAAVGCNTNLGIILLVAPLVEAALAAGESRDLRARVSAVLNQLDLSDAQTVFAAIRRAQPGGLGSSPRHDVHQPARASLLEIMTEARDRDSIARAYATGYVDVFLVGVPLVRSALERWQNERWALVAAYLGMLSQFPDTHICRKFGRQIAARVTREAVEVDRAFQSASRPEQCLAELQAFDQRLKRSGINPGTSADFSVASFLATRIEDQFTALRPIGALAGRSYTQAGTRTPASFNH